VLIVYYFILVLEEGNKLITRKRIVNLIESYIIIYFYNKKGHDELQMAKIHAIEWFFLSTYIDVGSVDRLVIYLISTFSTYLFILISCLDDKFFRLRSNTCEPIY